MASQRQRYLAALLVAVVLATQQTALAEAPYQAPWNTPVPSTLDDTNPSGARATAGAWESAAMSTIGDDTQSTADVADTAAGPRGLIATVAQSFRCIGRDGTSSLYEELFGDTRTVSKCPAGMMCFQSPQGRSGIRCARADSGTPADDRGGPRTETRDGVAQVTEALHLPATSAPTSSEPRVVSLNVVIPTIALKITDDPAAPPTPTVMIVAPDPSSPAQLIAVPSSSATDGSSTASPATVTMNIEDDPRSTSLSSSDGDATAAAQPNDNTSPSREKQIGTATDESSMFSVVYMGDAHSLAASLLDGSAELVIQSTRPPSSTSVDIGDVASSSPPAKTAQSRTSTQRTLTSQLPTPVSLPPQKTSTVAPEHEHHFGAWMIAEDGFIAAVDSTSATSVETTSVAPATQTMTTTQRVTIIPQVTVAPRVTVTVPMPATSSPLAGSFVVSAMRTTPVEVVESTWTSGPQPPQSPVKPTSSQTTPRPLDLASPTLPPASSEVSPSLFAPVITVIFHPITPTTTPASPPTPPGNAATMAVTQKPIAALPAPPVPSQLATPAPSQLAAPVPSLFAAPAPLPFATPVPSQLATPAPSPFAAPGPFPFAAPIMSSRRPGGEVMLPRLMPNNPTSAPAIPPAPFASRVTPTSDGARQSQLMSTPPAPHHKSYSNVPSIAGFLHDVCNVSPEKLTIGGKPVARASTDQLSHKDGVNAVINDPESSSSEQRQAKLAKGGAGDSDYSHDDDDQLDGGDDTGPATTTHRAVVNHIRVVMSATPEPDAGASSDEDSDSDAVGDDRKSNTSKSNVSTCTTRPDYHELMSLAAE